MTTEIAMPDRHTGRLAPADLLTLEEYSRVRPEFRSRVMEHKKDRRVELGPNASLYFEDRITMQYQVQEILRIERIFEAAEIGEELAAYNPLIPDGSNWKATFMIEFPDQAERREALSRLIGIEDRVWVQIDGHDRVLAIADEDLERETSEKTSSVHFLRFELDAAMAGGLRSGSALSIGVDHPNYTHAVRPVAANVRDSLLADLD